MTWPKPEVGQVIRYAYLWKDEAAGGQEEGRKDRPAAVILVLSGDTPRPTVVVCAITHHPHVAAAAVRIPVKTARRLGLDGEAQWVVVSEANKFVWPGPDLRPGAGESVVIGLLPPAFMVALRDAVLKELRGGLVTRSD